MGLELPEAEVVFYPAFFTGPGADRLLEQLIVTTAWRHDAMNMFGKVKPLPRLTAWYGNPGARYVYSGIVNEPLPWTAVFPEVKDAAETDAGVAFNGVLLNRYRTGRDSMGWHADDEPEFGDEPVIASVSFSGRRKFKLKHKRRKELKGGVELTHSSLLIMRGGTQTNWPSAESRPLARQARVARGLGAPQPGEPLPQWWAGRQVADDQLKPKLSKRQTPRVVIAVSGLQKPDGGHGEAGLPGELRLRDPSPFAVRTRVIPETGMQRKSAQRQYSLG